MSSSDHALRLQPFRPEGFHQKLEHLRKTEKYAFDVEGGTADPGVCEDSNSKCEQWTKAGECDNNPGFMRGEGSDQVGACRRSCGTCERCKRGDRACYKRNREVVGYLDLKDEVRVLTGLELKQPL